MELNPYVAAKEPPSLAALRSGWIKAAIFGTLACVFGLGSIVALWGVIYWHWESTRQKPVDYIEMATYEMHVWAFYLIVGVIGSLAFASVAIISSRAASRTASDSPAKPITP